MLDRVNDKIAIKITTCANAPTLSNGKCTTDLEYLLRHSYTKIKGTFKVKIWTLITNSHQTSLVESTALSENSTKPVAVWLPSRSNNKVKSIESNTTESIFQISNCGVHRLFYNTVFPDNIVNWTSNHTASACEHQQHSTSELWSTAWLLPTHLLQCHKKNSSTWWFWCQSSNIRQEDKWAKLPQNSCKDPF